MISKLKKTRFIKMEERKRGKIGIATYLHYFNSMKNKLLFLPFIVFFLILSSSVDSIYRYLVSAWVDSCPPGSCVDNPLPSNIKKIILQNSRSEIAIFFFIFCLTAIFVRGLNWMILIGFLENGARNIHSQMVESLAKVKISFFDENPSGRLIRRFSGDYFQVKDDLPQLLSDILGSISELLIVFIIVIFQAPIVIVSIIPCIVMYFNVQKTYKPASREIQRYAKILETPLWSLFTESIVGYQTIRAYNKNIEFYSRLYNLTFDNGKANLMLSRFTRWLNFRLKLISEFFTLCITLVMIYLVYIHKINIGMAGFLMSLTLSLDATMQWLTRSISLIESKMVSAERIIEFKNLPPEVSTKKNKEFIKNFSPPKGEIRFENFVASYREDLPIILNSLNLVFEPNKKTGIIGRTGAGKSSIFQALFRMMHVHSGRILIDGVDITHVDLEQSRSIFAIVPQNPHLFSGTIQLNLDRMRKYSEKNIWDALEKVELADYVSSLPGKLQYQLVERGANLSVGQRQLLCIARAVLTEANIVLMDEATASVDLETDALIQNAIAKAFADKTILVIAHRLETLETASKIAVLEAGKLFDYDNSSVILEKYSDGIYAHLI